MVMSRRKQILECAEKIKMPKFKKVTNVHNISLNSDMHGNVYELEIKTLGISLHYQIRCSPSVHICFPKASLCHPFRAIIVPNNCRSVNRLREKHSATYRTCSSTDSLCASFLTKSADIISKTIYNLNDEIHFPLWRILFIFSIMNSILCK